MGQKYSHLSLFERQRLFQWYHCNNYGVRKIARLLDRSHSTISREIRRHQYCSYVPTYYPNPADLDYRIMVRDRGQRSRLKSQKTRDYVDSKLQKGWSPELISGRLKHSNDSLHPECHYVCHESIYQYIYKDRQDLIPCLTRKHRTRKRKYPKRSTPAKITTKTPISERPEAVNNRTEIGHWESDSIVSAGNKPGCNVIVERLTRLTHISLIKTKNAQDTADAIYNKLHKYPEGFIKSITYDNGTENSNHLRTNQALSCCSYFCNPYHSWEKGSVEQVNGLIRRVFPKGTDFSNVTPDEISLTEDKINNRPRKCLNYKTPVEVYSELALSGTPDFN